MAKQQLHPGARWLFRLQVYYVIFVILAIQVFGAIFTLAMISIIGRAFDFLITALVGLVVGEIYARMSFNRFFYELGKDELKIERGIIWKKYSAIPHARIQNVDIERGIIARMLRFSSVNVHTAGYAAGPQTWSGAVTAEGVLPAVDVKEAEKIREFLLKKTKKGRGL